MIVPSPTIVPASRESAVETGPATDAPAPFPTAPPPDLAAGELAARIDEARRVGAYPLLLLLSRALGPGAGVGTSCAAGEERIRFRHDGSLAFRTGEVSAVVTRDLAPDADRLDAAPRTVVEITTAFLGLSGTASPLPPYVAEEVAQEDLDEPRLRDFLDIFHHRAVSLFFRARARSDYPNGYRSDQGDAWSRRVLALLGVDPDAAPAVPAWRLLRWAPLLAELHPTAAALEAALEDTIADVRVTVEPFVGAWVEIPPDQLCCLGRESSRLGRELVLGRRLFDRSGRFRIVLGPLTRAQHAALGPGRELAARIAAIVNAFGGDPLEYDVTLWLARDAALRLALGKSRLGRDAWLGGQVRETRVNLDVPV